MTRKPSSSPESISGRALVDIPQLGLFSGQYATIAEEDYAAFADAGTFDTSAVDPTEIAP